jgi:hypothetical protein
MKPGLIEKVYAAILLVIFGLIVVHAPLSVYFGTLLPGTELLIKSWKEILILLAVPFAAAVVYRHRLLRELFHDGMMQLILAYTILHVLVAAALLRGQLATMAGLAIDLRYLAFFVLVYVLVKAAPQYIKRFLQVAAGGAVVVIGFAVLQVFLPPDILTHIGYGDDTIQPYLTVDQNPQFVRINSTLRGPNPLGAYAAIVIALLAAALVRGRLKAQRNRETFLAGALALGSVVALWVSYSRSALGAAIVAVGVVGATYAHRHVSRRAWIVGAVVVFALIGGLIAGRDNTLISNVLFHENPADSNQVNSNEGHIDSLITGTERMLRQPIGGGVGSTGSASLLTDSPLIIENQYLFIAHEAGWMGLGLFMALFVVILARLWRNRRDWLNLGVFASGIGLAIIGLVLPVWVDDTVSIIWWGLAAVALGTGGGRHGQSAK